MRKTIVLLTGLLMFSALFGGELLEEFNKEVPAELGGKISIKNTNGSVEVVKGENDIVSVYAKVKVKSGNRRKAEQMMKKIKIVVEEKNGFIHVGPEYPKKNSGFLDWISGKRINVSVYLKVEVPEEARLKVKSVNGKVMVKGVDGSINVSTTNGGLDLKSISGKISAHTTNGGVHVRLSDWSDSDRLECKTTNGGVHIELPSDVSADFYARTTNGSIRTDFPVEISGKTHKKTKISGTINGGGGKIELTTTNGGIHVEEI